MNNEISLQDFLSKFNKDSKRVAEAFESHYLSHREKDENKNDWPLFMTYEDWVNYCNEWVSDTLDVKVFLND